MAKPSGRRRSPSDKTTPKAKAAAKPRAKKEAKPRIVIRTRHDILGLEPGLPGYRRGCKCDPCRGANTARMRAYRASKKAVVDVPDEVQLPATPEAPAAMVLLKNLEVGEISKALIEDLPAVDGSYVFQRTVSAMARQAALILDNADQIDRLDLISTMQIRILDALKRLEPPRANPVPGAQGPSIEDIVNAITGNGDAEGAG